ncbi:MAG: 50S ribosomal protein L32 [Patescibacteria group bacterium]
MAEPKKKLSKTRTHRRRANYSVPEQSFVYCSNCQEPISPHTVCRHCGYWKGRSVLKQTPTKRILASSSKETVGDENESQTKK